MLNFRNAIARTRGKRVSGGVSPLPLGMHFLLALFYPTFIPCRTSSLSSPPSSLPPFLHHPPSPPPFPSLPPFLHPSSLTSSPLTPSFPSSLCSPPSSPPPFLPHSLTPPLPPFPLLPHSFPSPSSLTPSLPPFLPPHSLPSSLPPPPSLPHPSLPHSPSPPPPIQGESDYTCIGNDITNVEAVRSSLKSQFDRNLVSNFAYQEQIFDYCFSHLGLGSERRVNHPVVVTEPVCTPGYCRWICLYTH